MGFPFITAGQSGQGFPSTGNSGVRQLGYQPLCYHLTPLGISLELDTANKRVWKR